jgi:hypothetical protein
VIKVCDGSYEAVFGALVPEETSFEVFVIGFDISSPYRGLWRSKGFTFWRVKLPR